MKALRFQQVDAFTARPFFGNPVAMVLGADGLTTEEMQRIAAWTNLSEMAFVLAPTIKLSLEHGVGGVAAFAFVDSGGFAIHIRCFAPAHGVPEDPVTGSANAALPACLAHHGLLERVGRDYPATQRRELGRGGRVRVLHERGRAEIGGQAITVIEGEIRVA